MEQPDYLFVGSGLASLSAAALLAKSGYRVCVIEAHTQLGGFGHTFEMGTTETYRFNAQLHYVWNCGEGRTVNKFLRKLGLHRDVTFERYDVSGFDRMRMPGHALDIPGSWSELASRLAGEFPSAAGACRRFLQEVQATSAELDAMPHGGGRWRMALQLHRYQRVLRYRRATLQDVFDRFGLPLPVQTLLALQWPDFLLPPGELSFFAWVMLFSGYMRGAWYPTHHFEHFVDRVAGVVTDHGGEVLTGQRVVDFLFDGDRVVGVVTERVSDQGERTGELTEHRAGAVVSNMDPKRTAEMVGWERFPPSVRQSLDYTYSASNFMIYAAVRDLDLRDLGFGKSNLFHATDPDLNRSFHRMYRLGDYSEPSYAVTTPSLLTAAGGDCPDGTQLLEILTVADHTRFQSLRNASSRAYTAYKRKITNQLLDSLEANHIPGLRDHLCFRISGTPTTNERYCLAPKGNSYGSAMTPRQVTSRVAPDSGVPGLYFCNATAGFPGFSGTVWTGSRLFELLSGDSIHRGEHLGAA